MHFTNEGKVQFDSWGDLCYNLFMAIGLSINKDQYLYDQDTGIVITYNNKYIKASINDQPVYAGRNDMAFDPYKSYHMVITLTGYYIDKIDHSEEPIGFIAQGTEDTPDKEYHRVFVDTQAYGRVISDWYKDGFLGYFELIFKLDGQEVDLKNFDDLLREK